MSEERIKDEAKIAWENFTSMTTEEGSEEKVFLELFRMSLKFQDRSTRHACAEAMSGLANEEFPDICGVAKAHDACLNVNVIDTLENNTNDDQWTDKQWKAFEASLDGIKRSEERGFLDSTRTQREHPEWYESPCLCQLCCSYGD